MLGSLLPAPFQVASGLPTVYLLCKAFYRVINFLFEQFLFLGSFLVNFTSFAHLSIPN